MPRTYGSRFVRRVDAPVEVVWDVLTDHARYSTWTPVPTTRLETPGEPDRNGVGAVRFLGAGPIGAREQVLVHEVGEHLAYTVIAGAPVRDYRVDVRLTDGGGWTSLVYEGRFSPAVPGTGPALSLVVRAVLRTLVVSLTRESERRAAYAA